MDFWLTVSMYMVLYGMTKQEAVQHTLKRYYIAQ